MRSGQMRKKSQICSVRANKNKPVVFCRAWIGKSGPKQYHVQMPF